MPSRPRTMPTAVALALLAGVLALTGSTPAEASGRCAYAAHRGYTAQHPENSRASMRAALNRHADYLELDVQVTKDGAFTLMHDETIDRTTTGRGRVIDKTWAQLRHARLSDRSRPPRLGSVLAMAKPTRTDVLLELKWVPSSRFERLKQLIDGFGTSRVVVNSFSPNVVAKFHRLYPDARTALETDHGISVADGLAYGGVMPDYRHISLKRLAALRRAGVETFLWTADSPALWRKYRGRVTAVVTNRSADYDVWRRHSCS